MKLIDNNIRIFVLRNSRGMKAEITNLGGRVISLFVPDKNGILRDVVLGFDKPEDYLPENHRSDFGAVIGRYANRLCNGQITIDGTTYQLPQNDGSHCLHGGPKGWQYRMFNVESLSDNRLVQSLVSEDGDSGFPGKMCVRVTYTLTDDNALEIEYEAVTDAPTVINMTNHSYFNLNGDASTDILNHLLTIDADRYTPVDDTLIPTGELASVEGTPMDFRQAKPIGRDIAADFGQLHIGRGYDHNWVLNTAGNDSRPCARLESPVTGITMEVFTTEPGMQVYTGNFLDGTVVGKVGVVYSQRSAVCLETQKFPDSPNQHWPESNAFLRPGETYKSHTAFKFSTLMILLCFFLIPFISSAQGEGQAELLEKAYISDSYELLYQFFDNWHQEINPTDAKSADPWVAEAHKVYAAILSQEVQKQWGWDAPNPTKRPFLVLQSKIHMIAYTEPDQKIFKEHIPNYKINYTAIAWDVEFRPDFQADSIITVYLTDGYDSLMKNFEKKITFQPQYNVQSSPPKNIPEQDSVQAMKWYEYSIAQENHHEKRHFLLKYVNGIRWWESGLIVSFFSIDKIIFDTSRQYAIIDYTHGDDHGGTILLKKQNGQWNFLRHDSWWDTIE